MSTISINANPVKEAALDLVARGLRITLCEGKNPLANQWQSRIYTPEMIEAEFARDPSLNVGVVLGPPSDITDIEGDHEQSEADFLELFDGEEPRTWKFQSKRGFHREFKYDPRLAGLGKANAKYKTLEIRGCNEKASQTVFPPSTSDGFTREWLVAPAECELATLPEHVIRKLVPPNPSETVAGKQSRPGDDYNARGPSWDKILVPHGWSNTGTNGDKTTYWRRPGKSHGISATTGHLRSDDGQELLYVFSANASPLEGNKAYTKFAAFTVLDHGGDFGAAAAGLATQGFGKPKAKGKGPSAATRMIGLLTNDPAVELFHTPDNDVYATVPCDGYRETCRITSKRFKQYLGHRYYLDSGKAASSTAVGDATGVLSAMGYSDGPEIDVHLRVAGFEDRIYVDRGSPRWDAIEVSVNGYQMVNDPPVKFWRPNGMLPLPEPQRGGSVSDLRSLVTLGDDQFILLVGALLSYLRPVGPYPITIITGEHGTAKSTAADVLRKLVDPKVVLRQAEPKNLEALMVAARNNWVVSYDNLSGLPQWLSDGLCRLSTGGGMSAREFYTNGDEFVISAQRPVILNSIVDVATRPDLLDRALVLELEPISEEKRRGEEDFWNEFEVKRPLILGALLDAVVCSLRRLPDVKLASKPRMADFAKWVTAAEPALMLADGAFLNVYRGNQRAVSESLLENAVAQAVTRFVDSVLKWEGTPTELYTRLSSLVSDNASNEQWPRSASRLTGEIRRIAPVLRSAGYHFEDRRGGGRRRVMLSKA